MAERHDQPDRTAHTAHTDQPDHELEVLEVDETVPPRPEEEIADAGRDSPAPADVVTPGPSPEQA
jgi:hypothetical protein